LPPDEVDAWGSPLAAEWQRLFEIREELEIAAKGKCQWVAAASGEGQFGFMFYSDGAQLLDDWKDHLARAHPGRQVDFAVEEDTDRKRYKALREEAERAASDRALIEEWTRRGGGVITRSCGCSTCSRQ
jgi:hypothetical protein